MATPSASEHLGQDATGLRVGAQASRRESQPMYGVARRLPGRVSARRSLAVHELRIGCLEAATILARHVDVELNDSGTQMAIAPLPAADNETAERHPPRR